MSKSRTLLINLIFFLHGLLIFLLIMGDRVVLPAWIQVIGRIHPAIVHLPIGLFVCLFVLQFTRSHWKENGKDIFQAILLMTSLTAVVGAIMGFFLSLQGEYGANDLLLHKYGGFVFSVLCFAMILFEKQVESRLRFTQWGTLVLFVLVIVAGHTGSVLTHGKNYILAPLVRDGDGELNATAFGQVVEPILSKKCFSCHNASKAKGGLVMTSRDRFLAGGKKGVAFAPGNPSESRMIKYIHLPEKDEFHMPPEGKTQLTETEIEILEAWITAGADFDKLLTDFPETDSFRVLAARVPAQHVALVTHYDFPAASAEEIEKLNSPFRTVSQIYQGSPALRADFYVREAFQPASLDELNKLDQQVVELNLAHMPITDKELLGLSRYKNLELLNLNFTHVTADGLARLSPMLHLKSISLCGTPVDRKVVSGILKWPVMESIYLWNTSVGAEEAKALQQEFPKVMIFEGPPADSGSVMKLGIPALTKEEVQTKDDVWELKHAMPGVQIRYTLNGDAPDSVGGKLYEGPIQLTATTRLKAIACKSGWYCSSVMDKICFVKGLPVSTVKLLTPADKKYPGEGSASLTDLRKGFTDVFNEPSWLGFKLNPMEAEFGFDGKQVVSRLIISIGFSTGSHLFLPEEVEVWGAGENGAYQLLKKVKPVQPLKDEPTRMDFMALDLQASKYHRIKLKVTPVEKLPVWKSKKRERGWVMVDEVFFY